MVIFPDGWLEALGRVNSSIVPPVVMRPILLPSNSVNQRLPSGPAAMPVGLLTVASGAGTR